MLPFFRAGWLVPCWTNCQSCLTWPATFFFEQGSVAPSEGPVAPRLFFARFLNFAKMNLKQERELPKARLKDGLL